MGPVKLLYLIALCIGLSIFTIGCASIVSDTDSVTYIQTDPEHARCELHGQDFTRVINTPNSISLPSEASPITVACQAVGYKNTTQVVKGHYDGWIWGNILFGGIIGAAIDGSRGAGKKFPPQVTIILEPERFADEDQRDTFYDDRVAMTKAVWDDAVRQAEQKCNRESNPNSSACRKADEIIEERDAQLAELERKRDQAEVGPDSVSGQDASSQEGFEGSSQAEPGKSVAGN